MSEPDGPESGRWWEFGQFVAQILAEVPDIHVSPRAYAAEIAQPGVPDEGFDIVGERNGRPLLVSIKVQTPQTRARLSAMLDNLAATAKRYRPTHEGMQPQILAVFPGALSQAKLGLLRSHRVEVWDGRYLHHQARALNVPVPPFLATPEEERIQDREPANDLHQRLVSVKRGRQDAFAYEKFCEELLGFLFCPPLKGPIAQSRNSSNTNRRDIIMPNYATHGFWHFMRTSYSADYVVVEAKNRTGQIGKDEVLQLANYLTRHGTGLVGLIMTRHGISTSGRSVSREQWILHDKLVIALNDEDVFQMLLTKQTGGDPSDVVRERIENFRLGI